MSTITFGSLFAGIGGFDLGFERAGMRSLWACEIDKQCQMVLAKHFPKTKLYEDITQLSSPPAVDVLCGGFPCQDLSVAGRRAGLAGERSGLWWEFHRIIGECKPRIVVIENVPGLLSSAGGRDFAVILRGLAELGYCAAWRVLDSQYFGVSQRRRRVFIVGSLGDGCAAEILFEPGSLCRDSAPGRTAREEVAATLGGGPGSRGWSDDLDRSGAFTSIAGTVSSKWAKGTGGPSGDECQNLVISVAQTLTAEADALPDGAGRGSPIVALPFDSHQITNCHTLTNQGQPPTIALSPAFMGVRRLTPVECERLQGFPSGWTAGHSDSARYRMIGNAVTVNVAQWIGERIVKFHEITPQSFCGENTKWANTPARRKKPGVEARRR